MRRNWLAFAGLVYVAAWIIGLLIEPGSPGTNPSAADVLAYFQAHQSAQLVQSYLIDGIAGIALIVFAAALQNAFRRADDDSAALSNVVFGAGIAAASVSLGQAGIGEALANPALLTGENAGAVQTLFVLLNEADTFKLLALALLSGAAAMLTFQTHKLPRWLGWVGVVLALTLILGGLSFPLNSSALYLILYMALPLLLFWVAAVSVVLLRSPEAGTKARASRKSASGGTR